MFMGALLGWLEAESVASYPWRHLDYYIANSRCSACGRKDVQHVITLSDARSMPVI